MAEALFTLLTTLSVKFIETDAQTFAYHVGASFARPHGAYVEERRWKVSPNTGRVFFERKMLTERGQYTTLRNISEGQCGALIVEECEPTKTELRFSFFESVKNRTVYSQSLKIRSSRRTGFSLDATLWISILEISQSHLRKF